ncbi:MAG: hypothetical protein ACI4SN_06615 [Lachnospiraceae bacterium]
MIPVNSFIFSFRKNKKNIQYIGLLILFIFLFSVVNRMLSFVSLDDATSYTRVMMHELYHQDDNIDVLFLGSSHCYRALNPEVTDTIFCANTFNAGTSSQYLDGSYALLVEAGKRNHLDKVYVEMYFAQQNKVYNDRTEMRSTYIISDYMRPSINRYNYLIHASNKKYWMNSFSPAIRNRENWMNIEYLRDALRWKNQSDYKNYVYPKEDDQEYKEKGFVANYSRMTDNEYSMQGGLCGIPSDQFTDDDRKSIRNIVEYCEKHQIELTFFSVVMPEYLLSIVGNYDEYITQMQGIAESYGVKYYDFNLVREEYFLDDCAYFSDANHLNVYGAEKFSRLFAEFFSGQLSEEDVFYSSYCEKMENEPEKIYGIVYNINQDNDKKEMCIEPVINKDPPIFSTIYKQIEGETEQEKIQYLQTVQNVIVPSDERGELSIYFYSDPKGENMTNEFHIDY